MILITERFLNEFGSNGALTNAQFAVLGIEPKRGWKRFVLGKEIDERQAEEFIKAGSVTASAFRKQLKKQATKPLFD